MKIITFIIFYSFFSSQVWAISKCPPWEEYQNYFKNAKYRPYRIDALKAKGIFIIAHGLNNTSDSMRPLQIELAKLGYSSVSLSLKGHRGIKKEMGSVRLKDWTSDLDRLYCGLKKETDSIYGLGYSMGALLLVHHQRFYKKLVFLSPAFKIKPLFYFLSPLSYLYGEIMIPSRNVKEYRSHSSTSLSMYRALFDLYSTFSWSEVKNAFLFINPKDELLDIESIIHSSKKLNIDYKIIRPTKVTTSKIYNHLIVDAASMGSEWQLFKKTLGDFLRD